MILIHFGLACVISVSHVTCVFISAPSACALFVTWGYAILSFVDATLGEIRNSWFDARDLLANANTTDLSYENEIV